jgi:hypothetical protein
VKVARTSYFPTYEFQAFHFYTGVSLRFPYTLLSFSHMTAGSGFAASDLLNANPQLDPLQKNGGPAQTMALLTGSLAINTADKSDALAYDQRGPRFARIVGCIIEIGAFCYAAPVSLPAGLAQIYGNLFSTWRFAGSPSEWSLVVAAPPRTNQTFSFSPSSPLAVLKPISGLVQRLDQLRAARVDDVPALSVIVEEQ